MEMLESSSDQMSDQGNDSARGHGKLPVQEGILPFVISCFDWFLEFDGVDDRSSAGQEQDFHDRVVNSVKVGKEIQITCHEHQHVQFMSSHRNT